MARSLTDVLTRLNELVIQTYYGVVNINKEVDSLSKCHFNYRWHGIDNTKHFTDVWDDIRNSPEVSFDLLTGLIARCKVEKLTCTTLSDPDQLQLLDDLIDAVDVYNIPEHDYNQVRYIIHDEMYSNKISREDFRNYLVFNEWLQIVIMLSLIPSATVVELIQGDYANAS